MRSSDTLARVSLKVAQLIQQLVGSSLVRSRNFCATRHFYFSHTDVERPDKAGFTLVVECPWRIESGQGIATGSEDYVIRADDNNDPSWEDGLPFGHLQDQKLRELMGVIIAGDVVAPYGKFVVHSAEGDAVGGFRLKLTGGCALVVFPTSSRQMEWMLTDPLGRGAIFIDGILDSLSGKSQH